MFPKRIRFLLASFFIAGEVLLFYPSTGYSGPSTGPESAIVVLTRHVSEGWIIGGGVFIKPNVILSAKHLDIGNTWCYTTSAFVEQRLQCGKIIRVVADSNSDLALVQVAANQSEDYYAPLGVLNPFKSVIVSSVIDFKLEFREIWVKTAGPKIFIGPTGVSRAGDSGSPVFQDEKVVGIVHGDSIAGNTYTVVNREWVDYVVGNCFEHNDCR